LSGYESKRLAQRSALLAAFGAVAVILVLGTASAAWSHSSTTPASKIPTRLLIKVKAKIVHTPFGSHDTNTEAIKVFFTPSVVNVGTVLILVSNVGFDDRHLFEINGVRSRMMGPDGKAVLRVTFKKPGSYSVAVSSDDPIGVIGELKVIK